MDIYRSPLLVLPPSREGKGVSSPLEGEEKGEGVLFKKVCLKADTPVSHPVVV